MVEWRGQNWASGCISQGYVKNRSHSISSMKKIKGRHNYWKGCRSRSKRPAISHTTPSGRFSWAFTRSCCESQTSGEAHTPFQSLAAKPLVLRKLPWEPLYISHLLRVQLQLPPENWGLFFSSLLQISPWAPLSLADSSPEPSKEEDSRNYCSWLQCNVKWMLERSGDDAELTKDNVAHRFRLQALSRQ